MKILITGNRGFIGHNLKGDGIDLKDGIDIFYYRATKKYDIVIHTAASVSVTESMKLPEQYILNNVLGTLNMLKQHPEAHFIYLSTCAVYGEGLHNTKDIPNPASVYAISKLAGEYLVRTMAKSWVILRLTNVIGEGERGEPNVYQIFKKEKILPIFGDGLQQRDFVNVKDVCKAIKKSYHRQGLFNVGSGKLKTVREVAKEFNKPIKFYPARPGEVRVSGITQEHEKQK